MINEFSFKAITVGLATRLKVEISHESESFSVVCFALRLLQVLMLSAIAAVQRLGLPAFWLPAWAILAHADASL